MSVKKYTTLFLDRDGVINYDSSNYRVSINSILLMEF